MIYLKELEAAGSQAQPAPAAAATLAAATIPGPHLGNEIKENQIDAAASHANQEPESLEDFEQKALDQLQARNKQQKAKKADSKQERRS